jgi:hypothetical protein
MDFFVHSMASTWDCLTGRPDEIVKKFAQNVLRTLFVKIMHNVYFGKK